MNSLKRKNIGLGIIILISFLVLQVFVGYRLFSINNEIKENQKLQMRIISLTELETNLLTMELTGKYLNMNKVIKLSSAINDTKVSSYVKNLQKNIKNNNDTYPIIDKIFKNIQAKLNSAKKELALKGGTIDIRNDNIIIFIIILIANLLINIVLYYFVTQIIQNIQRLQNGLKSFFDFLNKKSDKVLPIAYSGTQDFDEMAEMVNKNVNLIENGLKKDVQAVDDISKIINKMKDGDFSSRPHYKPNNPQIKALQNDINTFINNMNTTLGSILDTLSLYRKNNFSTRLGIKKTAQLQELIEGVNILGDSLEQSKTDITKSLSRSANELQESSDLLYSQVESLSGFMNNTAKVSGIIDKDIGDMQITFQETVNKTIQMNDVAMKTTKSAKGGEVLANSTLQSMQDINDSTLAIGEAITIIDSISFQTNILSLNAAVEAATAGEAGKGFAVVAQEVRNLANKSAEAAKEIKELVTKTQQKAQAGIEVSQQMQKSFIDVSSQIEDTLVLVKSVNDVSNTEMSRMNNVSEIMSNLYSDVENNLEKMQNTYAITSKLHDISNRLHEEVTNK